MQHLRSEAHSGHHHRISAVRFTTRHQVDDPGPSRWYKQAASLGINTRQSGFIQLLMCLDTVQTHPQAVTRDDSGLFSSTQWCLVSDVSYLVMSGNHHCYGETQSSEWRQTNLGWSQAQCAICCPTDIEINPLGLRRNECHHVTLNCLPGEQKLRLSSKRKRKSFNNALKIKFSNYIRFFLDVLMMYS